MMTTIDEQTERSWLPAITDDSHIAAYADWLQDNDDPRGELWALHLSPRIGREEQRHYARLRGTVGFLPPWSLDEVQDTIRRYQHDAPDWRSRLEQLQALLVRLRHPLASFRLNWPPRERDGVTYPAWDHFRIIYNPDSKRFAHSQPGAGRNRPGGYPDPLEAAVACIHGASGKPIVEMGQPYMVGRARPWPKRWEDMLGWNSYTFGMSTK